jgi:hypothetical protein
MFETIEIRKVENGFTVDVLTEYDSKVYVFSTQLQVQKFLKTLLNADKNEQSN